MLLQSYGYNAPTDVGDSEVEYLKSNALHTQSALLKYPVPLLGNTKESVSVLGQSVPPTMLLPATYIGYGYCFSLDIGFKNPK